MPNLPDKIPIKSAQIFQKILAIIGFLMLAAAFASCNGGEVGSGFFQVVIGWFLLVWASKIKTFKYWQGGVEVYK